MDDTTKQMIESALGVKVHGGSFMVTWVVLNWLGVRVKKLPSIPNDFIPAVLIGFGGFVYVATSWLIGNPFDKAQVLVGLASGFVAVGAHQTLVRTKQGIAGEEVGPNPAQPPTQTP